MQETKIILQPDYYLHNFKFVVDWVRERYGDLVNETEACFIKTFYQLPYEARCLLVRLSSRKGPYFRAGKLHYPEIGSVSAAAYQLRDCGLLEVDPHLSVMELGRLLTRAELLFLFSDQLSGIKQQVKDQLIEKLAMEFSESKPWSEWTQAQYGELYFWDHQQTLNSLKLLFFGNSYQDLTEFVLQDLGLYQYENYVIDQQHRLFKHRDEIDEYWQIQALRENFENADDLQDLIDIANALSLSASTPALSQRLIKLTNQVAYRLEMAGEHQLALRLYQSNHHPPARERRVRLYEKMGDYQKAWQELECIRQQPVNEQELQILERMAPRIAKKAAIPFIKKSAISIHQQRISLLQLATDKDITLSVEEIAQQYFNQADKKCFYVENILFNSLFGLWLWPEIFQGVQGAFANPFQTAPLDMYHKSFTENRQGLIQAWELLCEEKFSQHIQTIWQEKKGIANHWVYWDLNPEIIQLALAIIPLDHFKIIFERLLFDPQANRSGFPDLIQFSPTEKSYCLIEIKGPGDRLQDNQIRWLHYFQQHRIPAGVCYVD